ncbi:MAG: quinolinate synthase NadA, partial [Bdellovibrionales bacterium]|nr:quinolinate synthase NadA [Bdellovibrionales bacterium]
MTDLKKTREDILKLKREKNALILAHYYEDGAIQDIADFVGDSLALAQQGEKAKNPIVLMAGVVFMAESVKILSPDKTVLVPDMNAGCSLVDHSPFEKYKAWKDAHPNSVLVTYVNSSAEVKGISDIICTSSNAEKIISAIPQDKKILFGPDRNLGSYLAKKSGREMILWPGACEVHVLFSARKLFELKNKYPNAPVLAHPECLDAVLEYADLVGSTSRLLEEVSKNPAKEFIVATESGIFHQMQKLRPDVKLIQAPAEGSCACNECPYMKLNTLKKIRVALETLQPEVTLAPDTIEKARISLRRMMDISSGKTISF